MADYRIAMLALTDAELRAALDTIDVVAVIRHTLEQHSQGGTTLPDEAALRWTTDSGSPARSLFLPAAAGGQFGGKLINASLANPDKGIPRASGLAFLFSRETAQIEVVASSATLSATRTAAVTYFAAEQLVGPGRSRLAVVGAGPIARRHLELMGPFLTQFDELVVFDLVPNRAQQVVRQWEGIVRTSVTQSARAAIEGSTVVLFATTVTEPYVVGDWISTGATLLNVSLSDLSAEVFRSADLVVVDDWTLVGADHTRVLGELVRRGEITSHVDSPVRAIDLSTLLFATGSGRRHPNDVVVVNPFGAGIFDVALLAAVAAVASELGLGRDLPL